MTHRFNVESLSAGQMHWRLLLLGATSRPRRLRQWSACPDACARAASLFLHWWAAGHNPRRHILACPECQT